MINRVYHGNETSAVPNMVVFAYPPQVTYLHTKIKELHFQLCTNF